MNVTREAVLNIDEGQLADHAPEAIFVLGLEYGQVYTLAKQPQPFSAIVHAENKARIEALLVTKGRQFSLVHDVFGFVEVDVRGLD